MWRSWSHKAAHSITAPIAEIDQPAPIWVISLRIQCNAISRPPYFASALLFDPPSHVWVRAALCRYEFLLTAPVFAQPVSSRLSTPSLRVPLKRITGSWRAAKPLYLLRWNIALTVHTGVNSESLSSLAFWAPRTGILCQTDSLGGGHRHQASLWPLWLLMLTVKTKLRSRSDLLK